MTKKSVLVLGAASWNRMIHVDALPQGREATIFAASEVEAAGSTGVGKAMVAAALGHATMLHATLGQDDNAAKIVAACTARGIRMIVDRHAEPTPQHLNIMDQAGGRFSIFLSNGAEDPVLDTARLQTAIAAADVIFLSLAQSSLKAIPLLNDAAAPVFLDLHNYDGKNPWYDPFIAAADVIQLSDVALPDPRPVIDRLLRGRATQVVLTKGVAGAEVITPHAHHTIPACPAHLVDSNGAGDAFSVALWHATSRGAALADAGPFAAAAAACAVETTEIFPPNANHEAITARAAGTTSRFL